MTWKDAILKNYRYIENLYNMAKSLISIRDFSKEEILHVLETAREFEQNRVQNFLEGKVIASLFFEPSTRTRLSFETAINRPMDCSLTSSHHLNI